MYFSALCGLWAASLTTTLQMLVIPLLHNNQNISRCCQSSLGGVGACWVPLLLVASFSFFFHFTLFSLHPPSHLPILPHVCICVLCVHVHAHGHTHMHMGSSNSMRSMTMSLLNQSLLLVFEKESLCKAEPFLIQLDRQSSELQESFCLSFPGAGVTRTANSLAFYKHAWVLDWWDTLTVPVVCFSYLKSRLGSKLVV